MNSYELQQKKKLAHNQEDSFSPLEPAPQKGTEHRVSKFLGICMEGWPFVGLGFLITISVGVFAGTPWVYLAIVFNVWVAWFFRDPDRIPPNDPRSIVSPADGLVIDVSEPASSAWMEASALKEYVRVSIFMSVFNVHVNRIPFQAKITKLAYNEGKFLSAYKDKASLENEQMAIWLETKTSKLLIVQIAGLIARRIVCKAKEGESFERGARFGLIRFGSRMDVYLPRDQVDILVKKGDKVNAGSSALASFK